MNDHDQPKQAGIIYLSQALVEFDRISIEKLLKFAAAKNQQFNITGFLYYESDYFFQYIEGEKETVNRLMDNIRHDERHTILIDVHDNTLLTRRFSGWNMRYLYKDQLKEITMDKVFLNYLKRSNYFNTKKEWKNTVWTMVNKLARYQSRLDQLYPA